jgi:hypothetical protein
MRRLRRPTVSLPTLVRIRTDYPFTASGSHDGAPEGRWNDPDIRGAVYAMHGRVCAYCQRLASDSRGDVEHYRPKSVYPWLMYDFANYLLGCRVCNSNRKSNAFPLAPGARAIRFKARMGSDAQFLRQALAREKRLLLDPADDPVEEWLDVDYSDPLCPIKATPASASDRQGKLRVPKTIEFFGLNTIPELIDDRFTHVNAALNLLEELRDGNASRADDLRKLANRFQPHGWAIRRTLAALAPDLTLTSVEEDLRWLVEHMLGRLNRDDEVLAKNISASDRKMVQQRRNEVCWTLAVLLKDPPVASSAEIESWINARGGRLAEITAFRAQL